MSPLLGPCNYPRLLRLRQGFPVDLGALGTQALGKRNVHGPIAIAVMPVNPVLRHRPHLLLAPPSRLLNHPPGLLPQRRARYLPARWHHHTLQLLPTPLKL